jgi:predicted ATP-grasp superfamily ATP-dependent carboligase
MYKIGDNIKIIWMAGEPEYTGRVGTIDHIDDIGQLHGTWGGLAVSPGDDIIELVSQKKMDMYDLFKKYIQLKKKIGEK